MNGKQNGKQFLLKIVQFLHAGRAQLSQSRHKFCHCRPFKIECDPLTLRPYTGVSGYNCISVKRSAIAFERLYCMCNTTR